MEGESVNGETDEREAALSENFCCFSLSKQKSDLLFDAPESIHNEENSDAPAAQSEPVKSMLEENVKMRITIDQMVVTLERWMRKNQEQTATNELLKEKLREADRQKEEHQREIDALRAEVKGYQADWLELRLNCLQAKEEKEQAQKVILKLQEENWALRKSHSAFLISREPHVNALDGRIPEMLRRGPARHGDIAK